VWLKGVNFAPGAFREIQPPGANGNDGRHRQAESGRMALSGLKRTQIWHGLLIGNYHAKL
jgi:hypothetical protein